MDLEQRVRFQTRQILRGSEDELPMHHRLGSVHLNAKRCNESKSEWKHRLTNQLCCSWRYLQGCPGQSFVQQDQGTRQTHPLLETEFQGALRALARAKEL